MGVLSGLKPEKVFYYFEELCKIPHGSYHTKQISDYLVQFAKERNLECSQDDSNNVVIRKAASAGYEDAPVVILQGHCDMVCEKTADSTHDFEKDGLDLMIEGDYVTANGTTLGGDDGIAVAYEDVAPLMIQGHMDMVCEKEPGSTIDFENDGLTLEVNGDYISAKGTTLGGDDGIAVAYALAILDDDTLKHPALEVVITTDEEVGLLGAKALDCSQLKGKYLINMDSEEEGYLWVSCAGGLSAITTIPVRYQEVSGEKYELVISGLNGGHSGAEIDKNRANSNKLIGQALFTLEQDIPFCLTALEGGTKDNAIPRLSKAVFVADKEAEEAIFAAAEKLQNDWRTEYTGTDEGITVTVKKIGETTAEKALEQVSQEKIIFFLVQVPYGIQKMSGSIEGLVETSINPGILMLNEEECKIVSSVRSSIDSAKDALTAKVCYLSEFLGGDCVTEGDYPAWEYRKESKLRDIMVDSYKELFGDGPEVKAIHAGLECGLFYEKIEGLDAVSFGPTMKDIHTTEEVLSISSTARMWDYLVKVLENIKA